MKSGFLQPIKITRATRRPEQQGVGDDNALPSDIGYSSRGGTAGSEPLVGTMGQGRAVGRSRALEEGGAPGVTGSFDLGATPSGPRADPSRRNMLVGSPVTSPRPAPTTPRATVPTLSVGLRARRRDFVGPEHANIAGSFNGEQMLLALGVVKADPAGVLAMCFVDAGGLAEVASDLELARRQGARHLFVTLVDPTFVAALLGRHDFFAAEVPAPGGASASAGLPSAGDACVPASLTAADASSARSGAAAASGAFSPPRSAAEPFGAAASGVAGHGPSAALATLLHNLHGWTRAHGVRCTVLATRDAAGLVRLGAQPDVPPSHMVTAWTMRLRSEIELCRRRALPTAALHVHGTLCHSSQCGRGEVPSFVG